MERFRRLGLCHDAHEGGVWCVSGAPSATNCDFVTGGADGFICFWGFSGRTEVSLSPQSGLQEKLKRPRNSNDDADSSVGAGTSGSFSRVNCFASTRHHSLGVVAIAIASEATVGASSSLDGTLRLWDVTEPDNPGRTVADLSATNAEVWAVAISADGSRVVTGGSSGVIHIVDTRRAACETTFTLNLDGATQGERMCISLAINCQASRLVVGAQNGIFCVSLVGKEPFFGKKISGHSGPVRDVAFLSDGISCVSCGDDALVNLIDTESSRLVITLRGHAGVVTSVSPSPCGKYVASGSSDRTMKVWDTKLREQVYSVSEHSDTVWAVAYIAKNRIVAVGDDGCVSVVDAEHADTVTA